jgi:hypothetical protein
VGHAPEEGEEGAEAAAGGEGELAAATAAEQQARGEAAELQQLLADSRSEAAELREGAREGKGGGGGGGGAAAAGRVCELEQALVAAQEAAGQWGAEKASLEEALEKQREQLQQAMKVHRTRTCC